MTPTACCRYLELEVSTTSFSLSFWPSTTRYACPLKYFYEEILRQKASPVAADLFMKVIARSRNVLRKDPYFRLGLVKQDNDDNKFVDCAFVCQADYIVTDDGHFDDAAKSPFPLFRVMGLDAFAKMMKSS